jgi:TonB-dependent starch-binding outer membrane protein SusC
MVDRNVEIGRPSQRTAPFQSSPDGEIAMTIKHKLLAGFVLLGSLLVFAPPTAAQQEPGRITGQVTDAQSGAPLSEVQVFIPGTGIGTLTRTNGRFIILNVAPGVKELRAERIGMSSVSQQVTVASGQAVDVNFQLGTQALGLDEIVVTGQAGAARRREVGNTIAQIKAADIPGKALTSQDMLIGSAPGLTISAAGGEMGNASAIRLRGNHSVSMSNTPIIYVDGIRIRSEATPPNNAKDFPSQRGANIRVSPLEQINPSDIERIEIIKGPAATTLYGTEASAGVIQIFTKSGSSGSTVWTVESEQGFVWSRKFGMDVGSTGAECARVNICNFDYYRWDPLLKTGYNPGYDGSVRGGGQNLQYFVSTGYNQNEGFLPNEYAKKFQTRGNFTFTPANALQFTWNTGYTHSWQQNVSQSNSQGLGHNVYRGLANFFSNDSIQYLNKILDYDLEAWIDRLTTGGTATWSPMPDLTTRVTVGYDFLMQDSKNLRPFGFFGFPTGALLQDNWQNKALTVDYVGTFNFGLMSNVKSSFSWGGQAVGQETYLLEAWGENFPGAAKPTVNSASTRQGYEERAKVWNAGFFLQDVFDITNRYFLTLGLRVDGNSAFGSGFGLQMYPKISGSWVLSDEAFWPGWGSVKMRAAYGRSGRAPGAFDAVRTWDASGAWNNQPAFVPKNRGNPDLGPEVSAEVEAGFDSSWKDDRIKLDFTYYRSTTSDALLNVSGIASVGFSSAQLTNVGKLQNTGLEVALNTTPILSENWGWDVGVNVSTNHSKALDLGPLKNIASQGIYLNEPVPVVTGRFVRNPDAFADPLASCDLAAAKANPALPCIEATHIYGPASPTLTIAPSTSLRMPWGINLSARGEYKGGNYIQDSNIEPGAVTRSAMVATCWPYYADATLGKTNALKPLAEIPALYRARCIPALSNAGYFTYQADFFRLRSVSATIPVDFLMPDQINSATDGSEALSQDISPRVPPPISFISSIRITF